MRVGLGILAIVLLQAPGALAHPLAPALFEITERGQGRAEVLWRTSRLRPRGVDLQPSLTPPCAAVAPPRAVEAERSVDVRWSVDCGEAGLVGRTVAIRGLDGARIDAIVRVQLADGRSLNRVLRGGDAELVVPARQSPIQVARDYAALGVEHILTGADHLLFVLGLLLLVDTTRRLVQTITAFTLGHSITLSLVALGVTKVPPGPVELLIAASILVLAVELTRPADAPPDALRRRPWIVGVGFGLLHGMGFAGALAQVGLPQEEIPVALFSFNVGIEIGQLAFIAAVLLARRALSPAWPSTRPWLARAPAYAIGSLAAYWCFTRAAELF